MIDRSFCPPSGILKPRTPTSRGLSRRDALVLGGGVALSLAGSRATSAQTKLIIPGGEIKPIDIAIPSFVPGTPQDAEAAAGVTQVITNNLKRSGLFNPIDPNAYIEKI